MVSALKFSSWLHQPEDLTENEKIQISELANEYPYFLPVQFLEWKNNTAQRMPLIDFLQLNPANIVIIHSLLHPKTSKKIESPSASFTMGENTDYFTADDFSQIADLPVESMFSAREEGKKQIHEEANSEEKSLMVVMSFTEWLSYLQSKTKKAKEEEESQSALRAMWQRQKLAAALEEEEEEIPEHVFEMAVNSIMPEEELISESLALIFAQQGKKEKAIEMFKKLSLQIPEKSAYFAQKIKNLQKEN